MSNEKLFEMRYVLEDELSVRVLTHDNLCVCVESLPLLYRPKFPTVRAIFKRAGPLRKVLIKFAREIYEEDRLLVLAGVDSLSNADLFSVCVERGIWVASTSSIELPEASDDNQQVVSVEEKASESPSSSGSSSPSSTTVETTKTTENEEEIGDNMTEETAALLRARLQDWLDFTTSMRVHPDPSLLVVIMCLKNRWSRTQNVNK